jgi:uncharacterized protein
MANPFVHVELNTTDVSKAKDFYGNLFGWKLEDVPMPSGTYTMIQLGEGTGGGIMQHPGSLEAEWELRAGICSYSHPSEKPWSD